MYWQLPKEESTSFPDVTNQRTCIILISQSRVGTLTLFISPLATTSILSLRIKDPIKLSELFLLSSDALLLLN